MKNFQTWWDELPSAWRSDEGCHRHKLARDAWNAGKKEPIEQVISLLELILKDVQTVEPGNCVHRCKSIESGLDSTLRLLDKYKS